MWYVFEVEMWEQVLEVDEKEYGELEIEAWDLGEQLL